MIFRQKDTSSSKAATLKLIMAITTVSVALISLGVIIGGAYSKRRSNLDLEYETTRPSARFTNVLRHQIDHALRQSSFNSFSYGIFEAYGGSELESNSEKKLMLETLSAMILKEGFKNSKFGGNYVTLFNYYHSLDTFTKEKMAILLNIAAIFHEKRIKLAARGQGVFVNKEDVIQWWTEAFDRASALKQEMELMVKKKVMGIVNHSKMINKELLMKMGKISENVNVGRLK